MSQQPPSRSLSKPPTLRLTSPTKPSTGYLLRSITIGQKTLRTKMHTKLVSRKQPNDTKALVEVETDKPEFPLYIALDGQTKEFNVVDENDILQPPGSHLAIPVAGLRWAVCSIWSPKIVLLPEDGGACVAVELADCMMAEAFVREIEEETEIELDLTSK